MAFIAIDAKADVQGSKKGKMTPAQHAQINSWSLVKKTGIFDWGGKCESQQAKYTAVSGATSVTVDFKSGYLSIYGRIVECEAGTMIDIPLSVGGGSKKGKILLVYRLGAFGDEEFKLEYREGDTALTQQDLSANPNNGIYEFELYSYVATANTLSLTRENKDYIPSVEKKFENFYNEISSEGKPLYNYDDSKGTIEERLTKLGFKKGALTFCGISYAPSDNTTLLDATQGIFRHGNYVVGVLVFSKLLTATDVSSYFNVGKTPFGVIPEEFRPAKNVTFYITGTENDGYKARTFSITIKEDGTSSVNTQIATGGVQFGVTYNWNVLFGYEAKPIE